MNQFLVLFPTFVFFRWSSATVWPANSFVRHGKDLYKSEGTHNCAEPGNVTQSRFYVSICHHFHITYFMKLPCACVYLKPFIVYFILFINLS